MKSQNKLDLKVSSKKRDVFLLEKDDLEYNVIDIISEQIEPIGSGMICEELVNRGIEVGEAKIGRLLRRMDYRGLTRRVGYKGRIVTENGIKHMKKLGNRIEGNKYGYMLVSEIYDSGEKKLIDVLTVRRALEKEAARLAAENINEESIERLESILATSRNLIFSEPQSAPDHDCEFHETIARISGNKILMHLMDLLVKNRNLFPIFGHIRKRVGTELVTDHIKILEAIKKGSPKEAEQAMENHISLVIEDVKNFFAEREGDENDKN